MAKIQNFLHSGERSGVKGFSNNTKSTLMKKQWSKYLSKGIALSMMRFNKNSPLLKSYKNSSYCCESITTNEVGKISSTYCKNRWCLVCSRIKTAMSMDGYLPELNALNEPVFVTLTLPTVRGSDLPKRIAEMQKAWRLIVVKAGRAKYKRTHVKFKGIKKSECTIRPNGFYHYHYHAILDTKASGDWLIDQWLKQFPEADIKGQDVKEADEFSSRELFKYAFKAEVKTSNKTNAMRYDLVFRALRGKRTFQPFGGIKKVVEEFSEEDLQSKIVLENYPNAFFKWFKEDWFDKETGEALVGLAIPEKVKDLSGYPET